MHDQKVLEAAICACEQVKPLWWLMLSDAAWFVLLAAFAVAFIIFGWKAFR